MIATARKQRQTEVPVQPRKTAKVRVPDNESREDKFRRLALQRVPRALKAIRSVEKLSAKTYVYSPEQVDRITTALGEALTELMQAFKGKRSDVPPFEL